MGTSFRTHPSDLEVGTFVDASVSPVNQCNCNIEFPGVRARGSGAEIAGYRMGEGLDFTRSCADSVHLLKGFCWRAPGLLLPVGLWHLEEED